jgi:hypothetical protein
MWCAAAAAAAAAADLLWLLLRDEEVGVSFPVGGKIGTGTLLPLVLVLPLLLPMRVLYRRDLVRWWSPSTPADRGGATPPPPPTLADGGDLR